RAATPLNQIVIAPPTACSSGARSMTVTGIPASASARAALSPLMPAPTTTTWSSAGMRRLQLAGDEGGDGEADERSHAQNGADVVLFVPLPAQHRVAREVGFAAFPREDLLVDRPLAARDHGADDTRGQAGRHEGDCGRGVVLDE